MSLEATMANNGWPRGFASAIMESTSIVAFRFVVVDNSRSMLKLDGHRLVTDSHGTSKYVFLITTLIHRLSLSVTFTL